MKTLPPLLIRGLLAFYARGTELDDQFPPCSKAKLPDQVVVDYVRVYDLVDVN